MEKKRRILMKKVSIKSILVNGASLSLTGKYKSDTSVCYTVLGIPHTQWHLIFSMH